MKITVQLFAILREIVGANQFELEVPAEVTPRRVAQILAQRFPKLQMYVNTLSFAVDNEIVSPDSKITNASEVALLPPVSGG
jgi:molybdopterin synthase catalytic subunit